MHLSYDVAESREMVIRLHRDELVWFAEGFDGVEDVVLERRDVRGDAVELVHRWQGDVGLLPSMLRGVVSREQLQWRDHTTWKGDQAAWTITAPALGAGPHIRGVLRFASQDAGTRVDIDADLVGIAEWTLFGLPLGRLVESVVTRFMSSMFHRVAGAAGAAVTQRIRAKRDAVQHPAGAL